MIAPQPQWQPEQRERAKPSQRGIRMATSAAQRRRSVARRMRYLAIVRIFGGLTVVVLLVMGYLALMANLTSLNYALGRAQHERAAIQEESAQLEDQLAQLRSRERLATIAGTLGMKDPRQYAVVHIPAPRAAEERKSGIAFLGAVAGWLKSP